MAKNAQDAKRKTTKKAGASSPTKASKTVNLSKAERKAAAKVAAKRDAKKAIAEIEAQALEAAKAEQRAKKTKKAAKADKPEVDKPKADKPNKKAQPSGPADHSHDHGRIDDPEVTPVYARLVSEIAGLVELVEQHEPAVRRAVFDSYVTAVIEFGATANDLGFVDVRDTFAEPVVRTASAPRPATASAHGAQSGLPSMTAGAESENDPPRRRRTSTPAPTLKELAAASPPRTNDQRNVLIVQSHELAGTVATIAAVEEGYTRMGWRVPVNLATTLRQSVRAGSVRLDDDGGYRIP